MTPTLQPGDWLWVTTDTASPPRPEELVVIRHPDAADRILIKRVRSCGLASFSVGSDNPAAGTDSRHFGSLDLSHFVGRVRFSWPRRGGRNVRHTYALKRRALRARIENDWGGFPER